ncbi:unnamed protein product [Macrosiphum euphorbiae]|uniref:Uncharacterized protein n=1 Tax=Macrosiphum euphorbiae TaxID=13131 RepID=A0AAV0WH11_9HEMI|nr:unnamed protein product [Macrosiphum euphorbiae]
MLPPSIFGIHEDSITYATLRARPSYSLDYIDGPQTPDDISNQQSVDVNDGPDFFMALSPSQFITPPPSSTFIEHPTPVRKVKRQLF